MKYLLALALIAALCFSPASSVLADTGWQPIDNLNGVGVTALALSPNFDNDHVLFAGLRGRGLYRSIDHGDTWQPIGLSNQVIVDLAISPAYTTDHTLFAAVGVSQPGYNVYRSTDGGATWQPPFITPYAYNFKPLTHLAISPNFASDHTLYALSATETYKSTDGGQVFLKAGGWFATHQVTQLAFSPAYATDHTLFATVPGQGVVRSFDGGTSWNPTMFDTQFTTLAVSPNFANDQTLAAIDSYDGHVYISHDKGTTRLGTGLLLGADGQYSLRFSPTFASDQLILVANAGDPGPYRSVNGGETWQPIGWYEPSYSFLGGMINGAVQALAVGGSTAHDPYFYAGTSTGLYRSSNWGDYWNQSGAGLPRLSVRTIAIAPNDPTQLLIGTSYLDQQQPGSGEVIGSLYNSSDGGQSWQKAAGPIDRVERVAFSPDFAQDRIALACTGSVQGVAISGAIYRSVNGASNWSTVLTPAVCHALAVSPDFAVDHIAWASVVAGPWGPGLLQSVNGGATWALVTNAIVAESIAPSPNYAIDHTLFAATQNSLLVKSIDGGQHWAPVLNHPITALALSPTYDTRSTVYAGVKVSSFAPGDVYRSNDGGATWQIVNTGIPAHIAAGDLNIAALHVAVDGSVLVGVSYGDGSSGGAVYRSIDGGQTWLSFGSGLSAFGLLDLTSTSNELESDLRGALTFYAATTGGLWRLDESRRDPPAEPGAWENSSLRGGQVSVLALSSNFATDGVAFTGEIDYIRVDEYGPGLFKSSDWGQTWRSTSIHSKAQPFLGGEAAFGYAFSPNFATDKTVFAANSIGLYKSIDGGEHWQWLKSANTGFPRGVRTVWLAPDYPTSKHLIASAGWGGCPAVSQDDGRTWSPCFALASNVQYSPDFATDNTIYAYGRNVYRSTDRGVHWTQIITSTADTAISPQFGVDHVAFASSETGGVSKTIDSGLNWTSVLSDWVSIVMSPHYAVDQTVFGLRNKGSDYLGRNVIYRSANGGATWISSTLGISTTYVGSVVLSPAFDDDHVVYALTSSGLYRSTNGGISWTPVPEFAQLSMSALVFSPGWPAHPYILAGTPLGVYRSINGGATWIRMNGFLGRGGTALALSADEAVWFTGDGRNVQASTDQGRTWSPLGVLNSGIRTILPSPEYAVDHTLFAAGGNINAMGGNLRRTTDNGATWQYLYSSNFATVPAISPQFATDHTIYAIGGAYCVARSINSGDTWSVVGTWPGNCGASRIVALPPNYPTDATVFAAGPGVWRLPPGETIWQPAASGILSTTDVGALAIAPNYTASHSLLAVSVNYETFLGWQSVVFRSDDGGVNWQTSDAGLPPAQLLVIAFSSNYAIDHTVYLVSTYQLYRSIDDGHSWTVIGGPPDQSTLHDVKVNRAGQVIVGSDSGVWRYTTSFRDVLIDGDGDANSGWELIGGAAQSEDVIVSGRHALRLGAGAIDSAAIQTVTIPLSATVAQFNLRVYPVSSDTNGDVQYATVTVSDSTPISQTLFQLHSNAQTWQRYSFDLTPYAGQTVALRLGVINDGVNGRTALYVDNASLIALGATGHRVYLPVLLKNS